MQQIDIDRFNSCDDKYLTSNVYPNMAEIVQELKPKSFLEIGVRFGFGVTLDNSDIETAYGIDLNETPGWGGEVDGYQVGINNLTKLKDEGKWKSLKTLVFCKENSQQLDHLPFYQKFDFVHIDGDHSVKGCLHDLSLVWSSVNDNGAVLVDDVDWHPELFNPVYDWARFNNVKKVAYYPDTARRGQVVLFK